MRMALAFLAALAAAGCSCSPSQDVGHEALWGERMNAYRALADAKAARIEIAPPWSGAFDEKSDAYRARRAELTHVVDRAEDRLDSAEDALACSRR